MTVEHPNFYKVWCLQLLSPELYFTGEEAIAKHELLCSCTKTKPDPGLGYLDCGSGLSPADHYSTCCSIFLILVIPCSRTSQKTMFINRQMGGNLKGQNQATGTRQTWNLRDTWNIPLFVAMWANVPDCQKICWWDYYHHVPGVWQCGTLSWPIVFSKFTWLFFLILCHVVHVCYAHLFPVYFSEFMVWAVLLFCKSYWSVLSACTNEIKCH